MAIPDPLTAVVAFLLADTPVTDLVDTRVYGEEIPDDLVPTVAGADHNEGGWV